MNVADRRLEKEGLQGNFLVGILFSPVDFFACEIFSSPAGRGMPRNAACIARTFSLGVRPIKGSIVNY